eukprot:m51a1_g1395 hypothetical protein (318) ;mRNA; f:482633-484084
MEVAQHSRVLPSTLHTLDDLVFAAFQGPVLSLSSRVLHRYRAFTALLLLRTRWRTDRRLSQAEVAAALLGARCCRPGTLVAVECRACEGVLDVYESEEEQERLRRELPAGIELYAVGVRTRCTSSRKHVGSAMLVLAAELLPGTVVVSERFAIYARHAARHIAMSAATQMAVQVHSPPPFADASPGVLSSTSSPDELLGSLLTGSPLWPDLRALGPQGMAIGVRVNVVRLPPEEQQQISSAIVPVIRSHVPGYLVHKTTRAGAGVVIIVFGATSYEGLMLADSVGTRFIRNEIRNPLNKNFAAEGLMQSLLFVSNMD